MTLQVDDRSNPVLIAALLVLRPAALPFAVSLAKLSKVSIRRSKEEHTLEAFQEPRCASPDFQGASLVLSVHDPSAPRKVPLELSRDAGGWRVEPTSGTPSNRPMIGSREGGWRSIETPHVLRDMDVIQTGAAFFVFRDVRGPDGVSIEPEELMRFCTGSDEHIGDAFPEPHDPDAGDLSRRAGERSLIAREILVGRWPSLSAVTQYVRQRLRLSTPADRASDGQTEQRIIGAKGSLANVMRLVERVATSSTPILIQGETGTGKELIARVLHERSRRTGDYLQLNCAALPENLVESMLFGSVEGIFTGAKDMKGLFEAAHRGTLLLDEIGELSLPAQAKLLRVMDQGEVLRLGATKPVTVDVRILAATHVDLDLAVAAGRFRRDLLHRIRVVSIPLPRLAERQEDLRALFLSALRAAATKHCVPVPALPEEVWTRLAKHQWPGNMRELQNVATRAVLIGEFTLDPVVAANEVSLVWQDIVAEAGRTSPRGSVKEYPDLLRSLARTPGKVRAPDGLRKYVEARSIKVHGDKRVTVAHLCDLLARSER